MALTKKRMALLFILFLIGIFRLLASYEVFSVSPYRYYLGPMAHVFTVSNRFVQMRIDSIYVDNTTDVFEIAPGKKLNDIGLGYFARQAFVALLLNSNGHLGNPEFKKRITQYFCNQELKTKPKRKKLAFFSRKSTTDEYQHLLSLDCENL